MSKRAGHQPSSFFSFLFSPLLSSPLLSLLRCPLQFPHPFLRQTETQKPNKALLLYVVCVKAASPSLFFISGLARGLLSTACLHRGSGKDCHPGGSGANGGGGGGGACTGDLLPKSGRSLPIFRQLVGGGRHTEAEIMGGGGGAPLPKTAAPCGGVGSGSLLSGAPEPPRLPFLSCLLSPAVRLSHSHFRFAKIDIGCIFVQRQ